MSSKKLKLPNYGGQALIEGVLMRGKTHLAAAFRLPTGEIKLQNEELHQAYRNKLFELPFLRGLLLLGDALFLGYRYLTISANYQTADEEKIEGPTAVIGMVMALAVSVILFFLLPALIGKWFADLFNLNTFFTNLLEGSIRLVLVIFYLWAIRKMPEILNVFKYHGAEHKTINAFESGAEMSPRIVQQFSLQHPRCGTSFILTVVVTSLIIFTLLGKMSLPFLILSRLLFIAPIVMISYEYIRWISDHLDNVAVRILATPNLQLQKLTTSEPTDAMVEVAISAFSKMLELENE